ncbi:hypothetical protein E2C01_099573 [Portunus trituberculatus]|uniref:Uncharacterized protein n=1 Tax=Portunus trituberculatus TaxID=210409 RepID=A0A5B7KH65_PORTR|nr:hypothetical protein [Portunus trituberculatus]
MSQYRRAQKQVAESSPSVYPHTNPLHLSESCPTVTPREDVSVKVTGRGANSARILNLYQLNTSRKHL